jgi:hypothetical protein
VSPAALKVRALRPKSVLFAQGPCFRAEHSVPRGAIAARNGARAQGTMPQATKVGARPGGGRARVGCARPAVTVGVMRARRWRAAPKLWIALLTAPNQHACRRHIAT